MNKETVTENAMQIRLGCTALQANQLNAKEITSLRQLIDEAEGLADQEKHSRRYQPIQFTRLYEEIRLNNPQTVTQELRKSVKPIKPYWYMVIPTSG